MEAPPSGQTSKYLKVTLNESLVSYHSCYDRGGPLICIVNGEPVLYGVNSHGYGCGKPTGYGGTVYAPSIYAKVSEVIDWMKEIINT